MPTEMTAEEAVGLVGDDDLLVLSPRGGADDELEVGAWIGDHEVDLTFPVEESICLHASGAMIDTLVATITDEAGAIVRRDLRIRALCSDCGCRMSISQTGTYPRDGIPGVVLHLEPIEDAPPTTSAPVA